MIFKWVTNKDAVLGLVTVPDRLGEAVVEQGLVRFALPECLNLVPGDPDAFCFPGDTVQFATMARLTRYPMPLAVESVLITGLSPEQLETVPGFGFAAGAGYMRSLVEGG